MKFGTTIMMAAVIAIFATSTAFAGDPQCSMGGMDHSKMQHGSQPQAVAANADVRTPKKMSAYPIDYCIISGEKLGGMGDPVTKTYKGREVRFCCNMCPKTFEKDQAKYLKKLDDAIMAQEKPTYPLKTCVVTGEKLVHSDMGDPVDYVYNNHLVRFCCSGCIARLQKDPAKYMKTLDDAYRAADSPENSKTAPAPEHKDQHE